MKNLIKSWEINDGWLIIHLDFWGSSARLQLQITPDFKKKIAEA